MFKFLKPFSNTFWVPVLITCLGLVALIGDSIVLRSATKFKRAIADNSTHGLIGSVTWLVICVYFKRPMQTSLCEICISGFFSSLIDIDHFLAARSVKLKDALNLPSRPFLHCSSVPALSVVLLIFLTNILEYRQLTTLSWILLVAFTSHHIRDAARHGFWMWPFGSTPPLHYFLYIVLTMFLPVIVIFVMNLTYISSKPHRYIVEV